MVAGGGSHQLYKRVKNMQLLWRPRKMGSKVIGKAAGFKTTWRREM